MCCFCSGQFLHPSEEDTHNLMRFLVERVSDSSAVGKAADSRESNGENFSNSKFQQKLTLKTEVSESSHTDPKDPEDPSIEKAQNVIHANVIRHKNQDSREDGFDIVKRGEDSIEESDEAKALASVNLIYPVEQQHSKVCQCLLAASFAQLNIIKAEEYLFGLVYEKMCAAL